MDKGGDAMHGGLLYDGRAFANSTNSIIVVMNYRLGAMGFLYLGNETDITGNYGLRECGDNGA